ncbi:hypothetical protein ISN45_At03g042820 [Arabidopsis thaliana x Arabidopsis arenosa]|uniref:Uncharacterized protein n=3 Tax=Arabidopsis TaxID=3701 RepID=F4J0L0_ARATH|nr:uncharacterized protein AT3G50320 [Arabidopsis thaliana]AEE78652.1 hypothetical protein AT3G50320 [Arabidopsis thaliana]KAG7627987.1 hypothetical protein ISN45_At03g042820 [Arabidopsis thaliana x Arabidopsis arenosa]KAG7633903.1 hypothetical protein ISN44_As03g041760 [Arabidopsis suecica]|eukprot:NP_190601.2 hypothetical protein AT3G50320 [Arabidopsis thaliana]
MSLETKNTKRDLLYGIDAPTRTTIPIKDLANAKPTKTQEKDLSEEHPLNKMGRDKGWKRRLRKHDVLMQEMSSYTRATSRRLAEERGAEEGGRDVNRSSVKNRNKLQTNHDQRDSKRRVIGISSSEPPKGETYDIKLCQKRIREEAGKAQSDGNR